jgi:hypothetical protein
VVAAVFCGSFSEDQ